MHGWLHLRLWSGQLWENKTDPCERIGANILVIAVSVGYNDQAIFAVH